MEEFKCIIYADYSKVSWSGYIALQIAEAEIPSRWGGGDKPLAKSFDIRLITLDGTQALIGVQPFASDYGEHKVVRKSTNTLPQLSGAAQ